MNKGYWLKRSEAMYALNVTPSKWNTMENQFKRILDNKGKKVFWIPEQRVTQQFKNENISVQYQQQPDQILQQLQDNVDFNEDDLNDLNVQLKKAKKKQIIAKTKLIEQRLLQRKRQLFYGWSQRFFECFTNHFGRFRNDLIELHLEEERLNKLNDSLTTCFNNMKLNLNEIWEQFLRQKIQQQGDTK